MMTLLKFAPQASVAQRRQCRRKESRSVGSRLAIEAGTETYRNERFCPSCFAAVRSHHRLLGSNTELLASDHDKFFNDPNTWVEEIRPFTDRTNRFTAIAKTKLAVRKFKEQVTLDEKLRFR